MMLERSVPPLVCHAKNGSQRTLYGMFVAASAEERHDMLKASKSNILSKIETEIHPPGRNARAISEVRYRMIVLLSVAGSKSVFERFSRLPGVLVGRSHKDIKLFVGG